ncbi:hypothetical protein AAG570_009787 [Ranatra chinensis]|uniref:Uncharacterized protein n=1 Tax=Ranatra chinensis TaxID=642074 RepID=A0ABD0YQ83_9HEMI
MAPKRRNMFYKNKKQETTEAGMTRTVWVCSLLVALFCHASFQLPIEGSETQEFQDLVTFIKNRLEGGGNLEEVAAMMRAAGDQEAEQQLMAVMQNELNKDKRASYMSLCHFKICNMGRKRNPYWNTWSRA